MPDQDWSFIEKKETDSEGKKSWNYNCRHCGSTLLTADVDMLAFVFQYEQKLAEVKGGKKNG